MFTIKDPALSFTFISGNTETALNVHDISSILFKPEESKVIISYKTGTELIIEEINVVVYNLLVTIAEYGDLNFTIESSAGNIINVSMDNEVGEDHA